MSDKGLGRLPAPDSRDQRFPMTSIVPTTTDRTWRYWWPNGWWGDQGVDPHCVGYAWSHWLEDGPVTHDVPEPVLDPTRIYNKAQRVDEWAGEDYDGTSVRAGAKVLQTAGVVSSYLWAWDVDTVTNALLEAGPVVIGTRWYRDMFHPDPDTGLLTVSGDAVGGHAYVLNGVNLDRGIVRVKNSWGRGWGKRGYAYLKIEDLDRLIFENGEACLAVEKELNLG